MRKALILIMAATLLVAIAAVPAAAAGGGGTVVGWGLNNYGQTNAPAGLTDAVAIASGNWHNLALKADGTVVAWGLNRYGQTDVPTGLSDAVAIAAGYEHSLALKADGTVVAWGYSDWGQTDVPAGLNAVAIAAGGHHSLALKADGTVVRWGSNSGGQANVPAGLNAVAIAAGILHSLALKADGTVVAWGSNSHGQADVPAGLTDVVAIAGGYYHSLALKADGTVVVWGNNGGGQADVPAGLTDVVAIAGGSLHSLALKANGMVVAWGYSNHGQTDVPTGLGGVAAISAGGNHNLALVAQNEPPGPHFVVTPIDPVAQAPAEMGGDNWAPDSEVTIEIDDPDIGGAVDFSTTAGTDGDGRFELDGPFDIPFDIEAGHVVTVSQGATVKSHVVIDLTVTLVDQVTDTVSGVGAPNRETAFYVHDYVHDEVVERIVMSDGAGAWMVDFSVPGADGSPAIDIRPGMEIQVSQADEDYDATKIEYFLHLPYFTVSPLDSAEHMWGDNWAPDSDVTIEIDDPDIGGAVDFSTTAGTDSDGRFDLDIPFDVEAGHVVTVSQGATVKSHAVIDITVTLMDPATDTVSGVGAPNRETMVNVGEEDSDPWVERIVMSDGAGAWTADFSVPGADGSPAVDIRPGTGIMVNQADEDYDDTQVDYLVGEPATLDELVDDMVEDGRLPSEGQAKSIMKQAEKAPTKALTNYLRGLVRAGKITQATMDEILATVVG